MRKEIEDELDRRNKEIFRDFYTNYVLMIDKEYEKLVHSGLHTSGVAINIMYDLAEKLVYEVVDKIDNLINEINTIFKPLELEDLKQYIEKSSKTIYGHMEGMSNQILDKFKNDKLLNKENTERRIGNIKGNVNYKLNQVFLKNKNIKSYKKIEGVVIINTIVAIASLIIEIISLFV